MNKYTFHNQTSMRAITTDYMKVHLQYWLVYTVAGHHCQVVRRSKGKRLGA